MKKLVFILFLLSFVVKAQPPEKFYTKFGGSGIDIGYGVKETFNRQYIVIGSTTSYGAGGTDAFLFLVDSMGHLVWQKTFGGAGSDVGKSVIVNPSDSGFIFTGYTSSFGNGGFDVYMVRTDKNGNLKWQSSFGGIDWDFASDLTFFPDGNIIACGNTYSFGYGKSDGYVMKVNINTGALLWEKSFGGGEDDDFRAIKIASNGGCYLAGNTKSYGDLNNDFWWFRLGLAGDSVTSKKFGNPNKAEMCYDFMEDGLSSLVFCGSYDTSYYNVGKNDAYIIKTDLNCNFINEVRHSGAGSNDKFLAVAKSKNSNGYFFSRSVYKPGFMNEAQPLYMDDALLFIGATTYISTKDEETYDAINTKDNGFLMIGYTKGFNLIDEDVFLVKMDENLINSTEVVGTNEIQAENEGRGVYYWNGSIYIKNFKAEQIPYLIFDSRGMLVQKGETDQEIIKFDQELSSGIYLIKIGERPSVKFIKH